MAFEQAAARTPTEIGDLEITLYTPGVGSTHAAGANFRLMVHYDNGERTEMSGNLVPHLTQAQITALLDFMATLRLQATAQIIP